MRKKVVKNGAQSPGQVAGWGADKIIAEMSGYRLCSRGKLVSQGMGILEVIVGTLLILSHTAHFALHMANLVLPPEGWGPGLLLRLPCPCQGWLVYSQQCLLLAHWSCL